MKRAQRAWQIHIGPMALVIGAVFLAYPARAQQPSQAQTSALRQNCRSDYQAHCSNVPTGGKAALSCLQENAASLSPSCQKAVSAVGGGGSPSAAPAPAAQAAPMSQREEAAVLRQSCGADYRKFCHGIRPGGGRAVACLKDNGPSLSEGCQHALMTAKAAH